MSKRIDKRAQRTLTARKTTCRTSDGAARMHRATDSQASAYPSCADQWSLRFGQQHRLSSDQFQKALVSRSLISRPIELAMFMQFTLCTRHHGAAVLAGVDVPQDSCVAALPLVNGRTPEETQVTCFAAGPFDLLGSRPQVAFWYRRGTALVESTSVERRL